MEEKKAYVAPKIKSEKIEIGVFGSYGSSPGAGSGSGPSGNPLSNLMSPRKKHKKGFFEVLFGWLF